MNIYIDLLLIAAITIYVVDLSGFTQAWRSSLARLLHAKDLRPMRPFDCSMCMTWWTCIIYSLCVGQFSIPVLAYIAALSFLSITIGQIFLFIREGFHAILNKLSRLYE